MVYFSEYPSIQKLPLSVFSVTKILLYIYIYMAYVRECPPEF